MLLLMGFFSFLIGVAYLHAQSSEWRAIGRHGIDCTCMNEMNTKSDCEPESESFPLSFLLFFLFLSLLCSFSFSRSCCHGLLPPLLGIRFLSISVCSSLPPLSLFLVRTSVSLD